MTTFSQVLNVIANLNTTAAELKTLAATTISDPDKEKMFKKKAEEIHFVVEALEERRKEMLQEERQYSGEIIVLGSDNQVEK